MAEDTSERGFPKTQPIDLEQIYSEVGIDNQAFPKSWGLDAYTYRTIAEALVGRAPDNIEVVGSNFIPDESGGRPTVFVSTETQLDMSAPLAELIRKHEGVIPKALRENYDLVIGDSESHEACVKITPLDIEVAPISDIEASLPLNKSELIVDTNDIQIDAQKLLNLNQAIQRAVAEAINDAK